MPAHQILQYKDGYKTVDYCKVCGKEELDLFCECPGEVTIDNVGKDQIKSQKSLDTIR